MVSTRVAHDRRHGIAALGSSDSMLANSHSTHHGRWLFELRKVPRVWMASLATTEYAANRKPIRIKSG